MASKVFKVIFNRQVEGNQLGGGGTKNVVLSLTKAEAEAQHFKYGKEPVKVYGPLEGGKIAEIECETAEGAAAAAVHLLGANAQEGELVVVETANYEKKAGN
jgi:hypothetical protein